MHVISYLCTLFSLVSPLLLFPRSAFGTSMYSCIDMTSTSCQNPSNVLQNNNGMLTCDRISLPWIIPNGLGGTLFSLPSDTFGPPSTAASTTGSTVQCAVGNRCSQCSKDFWGEMKMVYNYCNDPTFLARNPGDFYLTEFRM